MTYLNQDCLYIEQFMYSLKIITSTITTSIPVPSPKLDLSLISKAATRARSWHGTQRRNSGEPYYSHPLQVALLTASYLPKTNAIITAILHDTLEDCKEISYLDISKEFGEKVADGVQLLARVDDNSNKITIDDAMAKIANSGRDDLLLIKFADRLHNIKTLWARSQDKQIRTALETICYFLPLGSRIKNRDIAKRLYYESYICLIRNGVCNADKLLPLGCTTDFSQT